MEPDTATSPTAEVSPAALAWEAEPHPGEISSTPFFASWRLVAALAASICITGALLITTALVWSQRSASDLLTAATTPAPTLTPPPPPSTTTVVAAPPVTVTITPTPPPTTVQAAPRVPAAAQEICDMLRQYPGMKRLDVALTLVMDRHVYYDYDTARPIVDNAVANYCPDQAR